METRALINKYMDLKEMGEDLIEVLEELSKRYRELNDAGLCEEVEAEDILVILIEEKIDLEDVINEK